MGLGCETTGCCDLPIAWEAVAYKVAATPNPTHPIPGYSLARDALIKGYRANDRTRPKIRASDYLRDETFRHVIWGFNSLGIERLAVLKVPQSQ